MSKWIKTDWKAYINSSHVRLLWINSDDNSIRAELDPLAPIVEGFSGDSTEHVVRICGSTEEATDALEEIINGLERERE